MTANGEVQAKEGATVNVKQLDGQGDGVRKAGPKQAAADSRGSRTCQVAKLRDAGAEWRMSCATRTGKYGKNLWMSESVRSLSGLVSKWPCGNRKDGWIIRREKARWREMTYVQTLFYRHLSHACMCTQMNLCEVRANKMCTCYVQKNARATGECMYTPVVHTAVATTCVRNPKNLCREKNLAREKINIHHSMTILTQKIFNSSSGFGECMYRTPQKFSNIIVHVRLALSCWYLFHQLAFRQSVWVEASRFPEACVSERPTVLICGFSMMPLYGPFPIV